MRRIETAECGFTPTSEGQSAHSCAVSPNVVGAKLRSGFTSTSEIRIANEFAVLASAGEARPQRGFTLMELLVVIAIIGMLVVIVVASLNSARAKSDDTARVSELKQIQKALAFYYADNGAYPIIIGQLNERPETGFAFIHKAEAQPIDGTDGNTTPIESALSPKYLPTLPRGRNGQAYFYESDGRWYCLGVVLQVLPIPSDNNTYCHNNGSNIGISYTNLARSYALGNVTFDVGCY